jgi:hypothetical protein
MRTVLLSILMAVALSTQANAAVLSYIYKGYTRYGPDSIVDLPTETERPTDPVRKAFRFSMVIDEALFPGGSVAGQVFYWDSGSRRLPAFLTEFSWNFSNFYDFGPSYGGSTLEIAFDADRNIIDWHIVYRIEGDSISLLSLGPGDLGAEYYGANVSEFTVGDTTGQFEYAGDVWHYTRRAGNWTLYKIDGIHVAPIPLPAGALLLATGLGALVALRRPRRSPA